MNDIFTIAGIGIISSGLIIILTQYRPEFAFAATIASGIVIILYSSSAFIEIFDYITELISISGISKEKYKILFRCSGISIIAKIASETCRDCGQASISSKIDFAGKIFIILSAMPLFNEILEIIKELIKI